MKFTNLLSLCVLSMLLNPLAGLAQEEKEVDKFMTFGEPAFFRSYDKKGIHVFETTKDDYDKPYTGRKLNLGAGFTMQFQSLKNENPGALNSGPAAVNALAPLKPGFMTSQANLYIDVQLADGIRMNLTNYLSSRHHNEFYVKGGYLQVDKIPFIESDLLDNLMRYTTIKVGHMEINYGDVHFRRPDGGHTSYSPFMEGNIMDAFATEMAAEVYLQHNGLFGMVGLSNGMIKGSVDSLATNTDETDKRNPSIYFKGGFDKQINDITRVRLSGSLYHNSGTNGTGLTLYAGDRTGSNYQNVMEQYYTAAGVAKAGTAMYSSGRFNPNLNGKLDAVMINAFAKIEGFELFGTYEIAKGYAKNEGLTDGEVEARTANQFAIEGVYRFGSYENFFAGLRYNKVQSELYNHDEKVNIDRLAVGAGWFMTKNIMVKGEYVNQKYNDFNNTDYRHNGKFNGIVLEAAISF
ncbi:hypothetical protein [Sphingobacterium lumbrici]|uniref:hypothetical protein n=1 Tax=Sphingobacterium lumbrici TaxID=2559600 RepID=UPI001C114D5E|nr:hypothetical protein [Sphingobacterium lumbrici]